MENMTKFVNKGYHNDEKRLKKYELLLTKLKKQHLGAGKETEMDCFTNFFRQKQMEN
jgi:hypothetical protein